MGSTGTSAQPQAMMPLTQSQLLIWTGQRLQPEDPLYSMILAFHVSGALNPTLFDTAFARLVANCDALRLVIEVGDEAPCQRVLEAIALPRPLEHVDLSAAADPQAEYVHWQRQRSRRHIDPQQCVFDAALVQLGPADWVWYLNTHHVASDAWSVALLYRQMQHLYGLAREGRLDEATALPAYADYVQHERHARESGANEKSAAYWRPKLGGAHSPTHFYRRLPTDRSGRTDRLALPFGRARTQALRALAEHANFRTFTPDMCYFQAVATALIAYIHRISGKRTITVGAPTHNRTSARWRETPGLFIETFPLQVQVDPQDSFVCLYRKVAHASQQMLMHAGAGTSGFEHIRDYDVLLNYITASFGEFDGLPMRSQWVHAGHGDRNHHLRMQVQDFDRADAFGVYFDMNVDVFVGEDRDRAQTHFLSVFDAFIADPEQPVCQPALETDADAMALLAQTAGPRDTTLTTEGCLQRFEQQVKARPQCTALICGDERLDYAGLDARASQLSHALRENGVGAGDLVALLLLRSVDAVVAMLALWKCAAAYLPLDPAYPRERNAKVLEQSGVKLVITHAASASRMPQTQVRALLLEQCGAPAGKSTADVPGPELAQVAYVIYTSGSTGAPKGVTISHRSLANYIAWAGKYYLRGERLDFPLFSSLAFDLTVTSLFTPLAHGGTIVVYPESEGREMLIQRVIEDNAVDVIKLTPSHLALIQGMDLSACRVKKFIVGGEELKTELAYSIDRCAGGRVEIYNEYGPTEGTVACMVHRYDPAMDTDASVPIGKVIDNLAVYVLDSAGALAPHGTVGELYIAGAGVALGYRGRDDLSDERFLDNPWRDGEKMYRTGDVVRWGPRPGLAMEYLARQDQQVKVRGVRIETGEIEAAMLRHQAVRECVVSVYDRRAEDIVYATGFCQRCGLDGNHPDAFLDSESVCRICRVYQQEKTNAGAYFHDSAAMQGIVEKAKREAGEHNCMMLLSGGKDSTYALCQLVEMGLKPLVFTLDNGYISDGAKANMRRVTDKLGLQLVVGSTPHMNDIFVDSLARQSNVCNGCFKTIYTLSLNLALERGIKYIFTGLSRGQIFETRVSDMFQQRVFDPTEIDRTIIEARKVLHRMDDVVGRVLDVSAFEDDKVFEDIVYVDFYRYTDVTLDEMLDYLAHQAPWIRPDDTGRSTNCLINEAGIYVHKTERGYHNYSLPYSWDVRLGHKERDAARAELDDNIDVSNVNRLLEEIGYTIKPHIPAGAQVTQLVAYYVADAPLASAQLRDWLLGKLPGEFVPVHFLPLDALPLTPNGKVDRNALPSPEAQRRGAREAYLAPRNTVEQILCEVWRDVLALEQVGINDDFFELGGDSILNIQIVTRARRRGISLNPQQIFDHPTVAGLADSVDTSSLVLSEQGPVQGAMPLTPIQQRFFSLSRSHYDGYSQSVLLSLPEGAPASAVQSALRALLLHHDGLRTRFHRKGEQWQQNIVSPDTPNALDVKLARFDWSAAEPQAKEVTLAHIEQTLQAAMDIQTGSLVQAAFIRRAGHPDWLLLFAHHLVVDGVSWWILLEDFSTALDKAMHGQPMTLPPKTSSMVQWSNALVQFAQAPAREQELAFWRESLRATVMNLPVDTQAAGLALQSGQIAQATLDAAQTARLLKDVPAIARAQLPEVLGTALICTLSAWSGQQQMRVDIEAHGREEVMPGLDLVRTVGWFTNIYPVTLALDASAQDYQRALNAVKARLRAVPSRGMGFATSRWLGPDAQTRRHLSEIPAAQVLFNYLGQWDAMPQGGSGVSLARPLAVHNSGTGARGYLLEFNLVVFEGELSLSIDYSGAHYAPDTIQMLARDYMQKVQTLIRHVLEGPEPALTTQDIPAARIEQSELDDILADFSDLDE